MQGKAARQGRQRKAGARCPAPVPSLVSPRAQFPSSVGLQALVTLQQLCGLTMSAFLISTIVHKVPRCGGGQQQVRQAGTGGTTDCRARSSRHPPSPSAACRPQASLPVSKLVFSRNALLLTRNGAPHLVFRVGNSRGSFMLAPDVRIHYFKRLTTAEGEVTFTVSGLPVPARAASSRRLRDGKRQAALPAERSPASHLERRAARCATRRRQSCLLRLRWRTRSRRIRLCTG